MIKKLLVLFLLFIGLALTIKYFSSKKLAQKVESTLPPIPSEQIYQGVSYVPLDKTIKEISIFTEKIITPTRLKISPDGNLLLATSLNGSLYAFRKNQDAWDNTPILLTKVDTHFPGFPPEEAGLTGIIYSSKFDENRKVFLLYTYKDKDKTVKNRISVTTLKITPEKITASNPKLVYQANFNGSPSHQITDGIGINLAQVPHLLVLVGEGFDASRAQDPHLEGGKVLLIKEDGANPDGIRPYPQNPKVQALGLRNAYVLTPIPNMGRLLIADTGPDKYDRLIALPFPTLDKNSPINLIWDGDQEKLALPIPDPDGPPLKDLVVHRLTQTLTFTGLAFLHSDTQTQTFLATMFGKTGSTKNQPGKEIWLGTLSRPYAQPDITFKPIITRSSSSQDKLGNPIGLALDSNENFFFADILESRIYFVNTNFKKEVN